jgi:hypothetical protein
MIAVVVEFVLIIARIVRWRGLRLQTSLSPQPSTAF